MVEASLPPKDFVRAALVRAGPARHTPWACRMMDIVVASLALLLLGPLMAAVALAIAIEGKGTVLFRHTRIGKGGVLFKVLKFRSMATDGDRILAEHLRHNPEAAAEWARDHKLRVDPRVSGLGLLLRKSSLDELPQLFNVLRGEMSIVGPRPIVQAEVSRYGRAFAHYCTVPPGITGIWQVSGRNDISYRRRVAMDALYSRRKNVWLDLQLIFATVPAVLLRRGSY
jgi:exopolysaccharide production protein ExoY